MKITQNLLSSLVHSEIKKIIPSHLRLGARVFLLAAVLLLFLLSAGGRAFAGSARWNLNPGDGSWYIADNWTPPTVPNGPGDTATFAVSNTTDILVPGGSTFGPVEVNEIVFNADASPFTLTVINFTSFDQFLTISGVGITNNSGITQNFVAIDNGSVKSIIQFTNSATAGNLTVFTNTFFSHGGNHTDFFDTSSAGSATFYNNGTDGFSLGNFTSFFDSATADNAVLIANGSTGSGFFFKGETIFNDTSDAGNATLIANPGSNGGAGGSIEFFTDSTVPILAWRFSAMVTWTLAGTTLRV